MSIIDTITEPIVNASIRVGDWHEQHSNISNGVDNRLMNILYVFIITSIGIWLKALFTGKMSWKNIGIVLTTSLPLYFIGYHLASIWEVGGAQIFYLGHFIMMGTILLLLPINAIKVFFWLLAAGFNTEYVDRWGNRYRRI